LATSCMPVPECRRQYYRPTGATLAREHPARSYGVAAWSATAVQAERNSLQLPPPATPPPETAPLSAACRPTQLQRPTPLSSAASPFVPAAAAAVPTTVTSEGQAQPPAGRHSDTRQRPPPRASVPEMLVRLERCIGTWRSPETIFRVQRKTHKGITSSLCFEQQLPDGRTARSILQLQGQWLQGKVLVDHTEHSGSIRLQPGKDATTLIFNRRQRNCIGDEYWGPNIEARRCADDRLKEVAITPPASRSSSPGNHGATGTSHSSQGDDAQPSPGESGSSAAWSLPESCLQAGEKYSMDVPVKNTFIQFGTSLQPVRSRSSPAKLLTVPFGTRQKRGQQQALNDHIKGLCRPCAYYWGKEDGCRRGNECSFCHLCDHGELRRRRKAKDRALRLQELLGGSPVAGRVRSNRIPMMAPEV